MTRLLVIYFCLQSVRVAFMMLPVFLILWPEAFSFLSRGRKSAGVSSAAQRSSLGSFLIVSGAGYLALQFVIRFFFAYDLFTFRLIGPGFVLLASGLALATLAGEVSPAHARWFGPSAKVVVLAVYSSVVSQTLLPLGAILADWRSGRFVAARELLLNSKAPPTSADVVFALYRPTPSPTLSSTDEFYYGAGKTIVYPQYAPEAPPDTAESYRSKLKKYASSDCVLDFSPFSSLDDLRRNLSAMDYDADVSLSGLKPIREKRPAFDPSLKEFLERAFTPGQYVACQTALALNHPL